MIQTTDQSMLGAVPSVMLTIICILLSILTAVPADDAYGFQASAPTYLTIETARDHLRASLVAATITGIDQDLLLSIAHHESRYMPGVVTREPRGLVSCGAMTPVPKRRCHPRPLVADYMEGALHLKGWIRASSGNLRTALIGYAGGYALLSACARGAVARGCVVDRTFLKRAWKIRYLRRHHRPQTPAISQRRAS